MMRAIVDLLRPNSTHVSFDGTSFFNETTLNQFNYTIYSNGTLSNETSCYLIFDIYRPFMFDNGTVVNGTSCTSPIRPIKVRGGTGIALAVIYAACIVGTLTALRKHGASHLPVDKNFRMVSRRWPWYWSILTAALGCVSGFMAIDVDREYIQGHAIMLQSIFWTVQLPTAMAAVWEMTRHWASWEERQVLDIDPYHFPAEDTRSKVELYIPLVFYLSGFLTFFLSTLRRWKSITKQDMYAATDSRFRASAIFAIISILIICFSALHTRKYYLKPIPLKIYLCILLLMIRIIYQCVCVFSIQGWKVSLYKYDSNPGYIYGLGYAPLILMLCVMMWSAWKEGNEDLVLQGLRRERDLAGEAELKRMKRQAVEEKKARNRERAESSGDTTLTGREGRGGMGLQLTKSQEAEMERKLKGNGFGIPPV